MMKDIELLNEIKNSVKQFSPVETITVCRDPKDNKFLELAVAAGVSCLISGDKDILELHPFRGIAIVNAVEFLSMEDRKSTRLNSSHVAISYAVFCLKKKKYSTRLAYAISTAAVNCNSSTHPSQT